MDSAYNIQLEALKEADIYNHLCDSAEDFRYASHEFIKAYAKKLSDYADFMTMRDPQGNLSGIVAFYSNNGNFAYVSHVWVAKCLRGGGYCGKLLNAISEECVRLNIPCIRLEVRNDNKSAIRAYKKFGFAFIAQGDDKSLMQKEIT